MTDRRQLLKLGLPSVASEVADSAYCFPGVNLQRDSSLRLLIAGRERFFPGCHVSRSGYSCRVIEFVSKGKGRMRIGDSTHDLYPGVIVSHELNVGYELWSDKDNPISTYFIIFTCTEYEELAAMKSILPGEVKCSTDVIAMQMLFQELIAESRQNGGVHQLLCKKYLDLILLKTSAAFSSDESSGKGGLATYGMVFAYIEQHFLELSSLADLAESVDLHATHICRLFQHFGQETPHLCIMRHKLNRAAELLVQDETNVKQVAEEIGYLDPFHFSRLFKRRFGVSPTSFRKGFGKIVSRPHKNIG